MRRDGHASFTPQEGIGNAASRLSPCHVQARQDGKLDPRKVSVPAAAVFAPLGVQRSSAASRERHAVVGDGDRYASAPVSRRLGTWAASGGLVTFRKSRAPVQGPIQSGEVEPVSQVSRAGSLSQLETHALRSLLRLSSANSSLCRAEMVQLLFMIGSPGRLG